MWWKLPLQNNISPPSIEYCIVQLENTYRWLDIEFKRNYKPWNFIYFTHSPTHSLIDHSCKDRDEMKQRTITKRINVCTININLFDNAWCYKIYIIIIAIPLDEFTYLYRWTFVFTEWKDRYQKTFWKNTLACKEQKEGEWKS